MVSSENNMAQSNMIEALIKILPVLRASVHVSQEDLAAYVGVSRQTYCAFEQRKRQMTWATFCAIYLFFYLNPKSNKLLGVISELNSQVASFMQHNPDKKLK